MATMLLLVPPHLLAKEEAVLRPSLKSGSSTNPKIISHLKEIKLCILVGMCTPKANTSGT